MMIMLVSAAVAAASPAAPASPQAPAPSGTMASAPMKMAADGKAKDCCDCCKDMAKHEAMKPGEHHNH